MRPALIRRYMLWLAIAVAALAALALAAPARADFLTGFRPDFGPSFGRSGVLATGQGLPPGLDLVDALPLPDGSTMLAGAYQGDFGLLRLAPDGSVDPQFNGGQMARADFGGPGDRPAALALQPDGAVVVAGYGYAGGPYFMALARFSPAGQLDPSFDGDGRATINLLGANDRDGVDIASDLVVADGRILVVGTSNGPVCQAVPCRENQILVLLALTPGGQVDAGFGDQGSFMQVYNGPARRAQIVRQPSGRLVLGVRAYDGDAPLFQLIGVTAAGRLDRTFAGDGLHSYVGAPYERASLALSPGGLLLVSEARGLRWHAVDGQSLRGSVEPDLVPLPDHSAFSRAVAPANGEALAIGVHRLNGTLTLAALSHDAPLPNLGPAGQPELLDLLDSPALGVEGDPFAGVRSARLTPDGRILVVATSDSASYLARFHADGSLDTGGRIVQPAGAAGGEIRDAVLLPDGRLIAAGMDPQGLTLRAFLPDGRPDQSFAPAQIPGGLWPTVTVSADGQILLAYHLISSEDTAYVELRRYDGSGRPAPFAAGPALAVTSPELNSWALDSLVQPDGKIVLVGSVEVELNRNGVFVARFLPDGRPDPGFDGDGQLIVEQQGSNLDAYAGVVDARGRLVVAGSIAQLGNRAFSDMLVTRLRDDGSTDPSFDDDGLRAINIAGLGDEASAVALDSQGRLLLAGRSGQGAALVRLDERGAPDPEFGQGGVVLSAAGFTWVVAVLPSRESITLAGTADGAYSVAPSALESFSPSGLPANLYDGSPAYRFRFSANSRLWAAARDLASGDLILAGAAQGGYALARWKGTPPLGSYLRARPDAYRVAPGAVLAAPAPRGLLANDAGGQPPLRAELRAAPANGQLSLSPDGSFRYAPARGFSGTDSFSYSVSDGFARSQPVTVSITVGAEAQPTPAPTTPTTPGQTQYRLYLPLLRR